MALFKVALTGTQPALVNDTKTLLASVDQIGISDENRERERLGARK